MRILVLQFTSSRTLNMILKYSEPQFSHLQNGDDNIFMHVRIEQNSALHIVSTTFVLMTIPAFYFGLSISNRQLEKLQ